MQKIVFVLFLTVVSAGCSVIKNGRSKNYGFYGSLITEQTLESIKRQNITANRFYIQKAEIELIGPETREKFLGSIKFETTGKYLISLKSKTGIEAARVFVTNDTILINDRINRKLYCGSPDYLIRKLGISVSVLPVIFGDFIGDNFSGNIQAECFEGILDVECLISGMKIKYVIDCRKGKPVLAVPGNSIFNEDIKIKYNDFIKNGDFLTPSNIEISSSQKKTTIKIRILKIESPWDGTIEFIPGNRYEILQLL